MKNNKKYMHFSERMGFKQPKVQLQIDSMDEPLKNGIYNLLDEFLFSDYGRLYFETKGNIEYVFVKEFYSIFLKKRVNKFGSLSNVVDIFKYRFDLWKFYEIYDFLEFFVQYNQFFDTDRFIERCNELFEREMCGYRFVSNKLVPIINQKEIAAIEDAIESSISFKLSSLNTHLATALEMISDRENPDYRNSIKESISSVESLCKFITQDKKATLGKALMKLKEKIKLHPALEGAFTQLYGYTSDADGIRHSISDDTELNVEDAVFMLVACSAFVSYLIAKCGKAGIL